MYKHLFGPVPSRRLGMSLGVDLIPHKVCTLNCVYCECRKTTDLTLERKEYVPVDEVKKDLVHFLTTILIRTTLPFPVRASRLLILESVK